MSRAWIVVCTCALLGGSTFGAGCSKTNRPPEVAKTEPASRSGNVGVGELVPISQPPRGKAELVEVAAFGDKLVTTAAVSSTGRKFVNFPRWFKDKDPGSSVVELAADGSVKPYPDDPWNTWKEGTAVARKFVCVQSIVVDHLDRLWVLDAGAPYWSKVLPGAPKLVGIDLTQNKVVKAIAFDTKIAPENSYLNDVRIDPEGKLAYLSDSNLGRIVVVDLDTGKSRSVLDKHPSTKAEAGATPRVEGVALLRDDGRPFEVNVDGIAIAGDYLYYHAVSAKTLYRIKLDLLRNPRTRPAELEAGVERVAETGYADGLAGDAAGNVYLTQVESNSIEVLHPDGSRELLISDASLAWPDSIGIGPDGLYVALSQLHLLPMFNHGVSKTTRPFRIVRIVPEGFEPPAPPAQPPVPERPQRSTKKPEEKPQASAFGGGIPAPR
jgi:sugar lactone lactonase YvrE